METKERELLELNVDDAWNIIIGKHDKYITVQTNYISMDIRNSLRYNF